MTVPLPSLPLTEAGPVFAVLLGLVLLAPIVARRLRVPDVVLLVLGGVLLGPSGVGVLEREGLVGTLGGAGLLVLMFLAGLEIDLDDFSAHRSASLRFGVLTFLFPLVLGTIGALLAGLSVPAAVLIGSCWSSHTLLAYPQFRRAGTISHPAVTATVGATILTDTAALVTLVIVVRAAAGALTPAFGVALTVGLVGLVAGCWWVLPRVAARFFAGAGQDGTLRLLFVLTSLFVVATVTDLVGIEPIVGAFVAGLGLNRAVPNGGVLMERVELLGSTVFVPAFLVATGMLVDLRLLMDVRVLLLGGSFAVAAILGKGAAAVVAGWWLGHDRRGMVAMFALSNAQAAATLAAVVVGLEAGLLTTEVVNAVVLVILVTCVVASVAAAWVAPTLITVRRTRPLGATVVAPVVNPATATGLLRIASSFARADGGVVVPLVVAPSGSDAATVRARRELLARATTVAQSAGAEARPLLRIDASPMAGIAHTVTETDASLLVVGWQRRATTHAVRLGGVVDPLIDRVRVPTLVLHDLETPVARVLVVLDGSLVRARGRASLVLALRTATAVARERRARVEVLTNSHDDAIGELVRAATGSHPVLRAGRRAALVADARADDLVVLPCLADPASVRTLVTRVLRAVPADTSVIVAIADGERGPTTLPRTADGQVPLGDAAAPPVRR